MATYYVGVGGSDANNGTSWALRKLTLNGAEDIPVAAGDTVYVGPGTYRESLTVDVSGSAGNIITYIGDYTGANTSGSKGVVRITGSADDIALTRANCITGSSKNYRTFQGFAFDTTSSAPITMATCTYWTVDQCYVVSKAYGVNVDQACTNVNITRCFVWTPGYTGTGLYLGGGGAATNNRACVVENCAVFGGYGVYVYAFGGVTVRNCIVSQCERAISSAALNVGQETKANNCIVAFNRYGLYSDSTARFTDNYNTLFGNTTDRTSVTASGNSVVRPPLWDVRWFFEAVGGGTMVTPFDLSSYSTLVEYNSGTGAPSTDIRGASAIGTYHEWGPLEYNSALTIEAGAGASGIITHAGMSGGMRG